MKYAARLFLFAIGFAALAGCGGGSSGSGGDAPAATGGALQIAFPQGTFYRQPNHVLVGQTVTAQALLDTAATPTWRLLERPAETRTPDPLDGQAHARSVSFVAAALSPYRLELSSPAGVATASLKVLPAQIEFVVEVSHADGGTAIVVRGGDANAPMAGCLVYSGLAGGCTAPAAVEAFVDGKSIGRLEAANAQAAFRFTTPTAALGTAKHALRIVVEAAPIANNIALAWGGRRREGFLLFDAFRPAQLGVFGVLDADVVVGSTQRLSSPIVGNTATVDAVVGGPDALLPGQTAYRFLERPEGSQAALAVRTADVVLSTADFVFDKTGRYTVEITREFAGGKTAPTMTQTFVALPHSLASKVELGPTADYLYRDLWRLGGTAPPLPADALRVAVSLIGDATEACAQTCRMSSVEAFLDGVSLGRVDAPQYTRLYGYTGRVSIIAAVSTWDIPRAVLGSASHALRIVATDTRGLRAEGTLNITADSTSTVTLPAAEDPNP